LISVAIVRTASAIFALATFAPQVPFFAALPPSFAALQLYLQTPCQSHLLPQDCHFGRKVVLCKKDKKSPSMMSINGDLVFSGRGKAATV
jgi:hypothetical protein